MDITTPQWASHHYAPFLGLQYLGLLEAHARKATGERSLQNLTMLNASHEMRLPDHVRYPA